MCASLFAPLRKKFDLNCFIVKYSRWGRRPMCRRFETPALTRLHITEAALRRSNTWCLNSNKPIQSQNLSSNMMVKQLGQLGKLRINFRIKFTPGLNLKGYLI